MRFARIASPRCRTRSASPSRVRFCRQEEFPTCCKSFRGLHTQCIAAVAHQPGRGCASADTRNLQILEVIWLSTNDASPRWRRQARERCVAVDKRKGSAKRLVCTYNALPRWRLASPLKVWCCRQEEKFCKTLGVYTQCVAAVAFGKPVKGVPVFCQLHALWSFLRTCLFSFVCLQRGTSHKHLPVASSSLQPLI